MKAFSIKNQYNIFKHVTAVITFAMVIIGLNLFALGNPTFIQCFLSSIILVLGFSPAFFYILKNKHGIPFLPLFGVIYSIYYALPIFILEEYTLIHIPISANSLVKVLSLAAIGLVMLLIAYYQIPGKSIGKVVPRISIYWNLQKAKFWAIVLGILGLIFSYLLSSAKIPVQLIQIVLFLSELLLIAIGILFILQLQGRLHKIGKILLWMVFVPAIFLIKIGSGSILHVLLVIIFLSLTYYCFSRKIPWKLVIGTVLLFIFFSSTKTEFRNSAWRGEYSYENPIEKSILFTKMASPNREAFDKGFKVAANRIAHALFSFAYIVDLTPKAVPYWMGYSYSALLWAPIPRVIYPWKPTITLGQQFGHRYSFLNPIDYSTSWNLPQLVEMYANFGTIGVIIGMFIMGIIYRSLYEMFCHSRAGEGGLLIGLFIFTKLSLIEVDFVTVFGNIMRYIILFVIISKLMKDRSQRSA